MGVGADVGLAVSVGVSVGMTVGGAVGVSVAVGGAGVGGSGVLVGGAGGTVAVGKRAAASVKIDEPVIARVAVIGSDGVIGNVVVSAIVAVCADVSATDASGASNGTVSVNT